MVICKANNVQEIFSELKYSEGLYLESDIGRIKDLHLYSEKLFQNAEFYIAKNNNISKGYISFYSNGKYGPYIYGTAFAIYDDKCYGLEKGIILRRFMNIIFKAAKDRKYNSINFEVNIHNNNAIDLYKFIGAEIIDKNENCYIMRIKVS